MKSAVWLIFEFRKVWEEWEVNDCFCADPNEEDNQSNSKNSYINFTGSGKGCAVLCIMIDKNTVKHRELCRPQKSVDGSSND